MNNPFRYLLAALSLNREQPNALEVNKSIDKIVAYLEFHRCYQDNLSTAHFDFPIPDGADCFQFYTLLQKRLQCEMGNMTAELHTNGEQVRCFIPMRNITLGRSSVTTVNKSADLFKRKRSFSNLV